MMKAKYSALQLSLIVLLIAAMLVQGLINIGQNSLTTDERCYVGAGKAIIETGNLRNTALVYHLPLSYYINSIFLLPLKFDKSVFDGNDCWFTGQRIIFHSGYSPDLIMLLSRLPFLILAVIFSLYVLKWAAELYGAKSGIFALFLFSFNPSIIAYSGIATTDFTATAMFFIASYYYWKLLKQQSKKHLVLSGIFFGFAMLSKITNILIIPLFLILGLAAVYKKELEFKTLIKNLLIMGMIAFFMVFAFYGFQFDTLSNSLPPEHYAEKARNELGKSPIFAKELVYVYDNVPMPMPSYWGEFGNLFYLSVNPNPGYVFGKITPSVVWYYVYVTFLLKTGIPILIFLAMLFFMRKKLPKKDLITNLSLWLPLIITFINFSITSKTSGIRHILVVYPFISILTGNLLNAKSLKKKTRKMYNFGIGILLAYYALTTFLIAPYYMAYINELGGGPNNGYKILVGSSLDHGQDLLGLKKYMDKNSIDSIKLSYFGNADPKDYNISYEYLPSPYFFPWVPDYTILHLDKRNEDCSEKKGLIAISVTNLKNVFLVNQTCYNWLDKYEPVTKIGYTIFIYDIK